jgi:nicotinamide-nucleotide amidase
MHELDKLAARAGDLLKSREQTIAVAESSSGGLISAALLAVPGASAYYLGGGVIYTLVARRELLGIPNEVLKGLKPITEEYGITCARAVREKLGATWGITELGAAGPTGTRYGHDAGISCVAVSGPIERAVVLQTGSNDRVANMWAFTAAAFDLLETAITES